METATVATRKAYRAGAVCEVHNMVHSRPKSCERSAMRDKVLALHGAACVYCSTPVSGSAAEMDRIAESCAYVVANLLPACKACNNARNRKESSLSIVANDVGKLADAIRLAISQPTKSAYAADIRKAAEKILANL